MRIRRKTKDCLNCGLALNEIYNFCPRCGQENNQRIIFFGDLVREFFINYFSFDTKFSRSIKPFLLIPGQLTNRFIEGKRADYVNPLRLYIIISIIFFFISTLWVKESTEVVRNPSENEIKLNVSDTSNNESDSLKSGFNNLKTFGQILADESLSDEEALDSLQYITEFKVNLNSYLNARAFTQLRKVARQDMDIFIAYIMQNMPVMMFLLLPVYALLLKLLYIRQNTFYVTHLIHGLHLHAFTFLLLTFLLLITLIFAPDVGFGDWNHDWIQIFVIALLLIYIYCSMLNVYQQGWLTTLFKFGVLGVFYFVVLIIFGLSEAIISFLIF